MDFTTYLHGVESFLRS